MDELDTKKKLNLYFIEIKKNKYGGTESFSDTNFCPLSAVKLVGRGSIFSVQPTKHSQLLKLQLWLPIQEARWCFGIFLSSLSANSS